MLPLQSVSTDIVPRATRSPSKTLLSLLTSQAEGRSSDQVPRAWLPAGREVARRRLLLAEGAGEATTMSRVGLKGMLAREVEDEKARARQAAKNIVGSQPLAIYPPRS